jgi:hypothetical protein
MAEQELILKHLRLMRGSMEAFERKLDELTNDMVDVKKQVISLENSTALSRVHTDERLTAIERKLEIRF